jgi:hypothetical protein
MDSALERLSIDPFLQFECGHVFAVARPLPCKRPVMAS